MQGRLAVIKVARIVSVLGDADNGLFGAKRVKLLFEENNYEVSAYAKKLSDLDFLVEILTALMGIEIGLPIPEPVIAISENGREAWFASIDVKHPDLSKRLLIENNEITNTPKNKSILSKLANWMLITDAISFDEWIANGDRNIGNVLYDGQDQFYLIDHNMAMRLPFSPDAPINNMLLTIKLLFTDDELSKQRLKNTINHTITTLSPDIPQKIADNLLKQASNLDAEILINMVEFLKQRLQYLTAITDKKIATKQISL